MVFTPGIVVIPENTLDIVLCVESKMTAIFQSHSINYYHFRQNWGRLMVLVSICVFSTFVLLAQIVCQPWNLLLYDIFIILYICYENTTIFSSNIKYKYFDIKSIVDQCFLYSKWQSVLTFKNLMWPWYSSTTKKSIVNTASSNIRCINF